MTVAVAQSLRISSQTGMYSGRASGAHSTADVDMSDRARPSSIDLPGPEIPHAIREPSADIRRN